ncbi:MAG: T9SS type A sorting domain-containing protein [Candidatus Cloacimonas sp.]|jgi:hypothetical protein|nr:T9SS type A sorting domain-containing protein [Candidatus Cloacimonas sp.]
MKAIVCIVLVLLACSLFGQWSEVPAFPTYLAGGTGEQVMPKTAVTSDGMVYICRFDNSATGNYDVYLQLLSQQGVPQWAANGILVSNQLSMTWLTDYDLTVDLDGNAIISFQDIRNAGTNNIVVYKVSPEGTMLWTPAGISLSTDTDTNNASYSPKLLTTSDNSCYIAWQRTVGSTAELKVHRLSPTGQKLWGENGITISSAAGNYTWPQLLESFNGDILLKYYVDSGPFWAPTRHLFVARINDQGIVQWTTTISNAGGITAWTQVIGFQPDGTGGAVLAWHDDRNSDNMTEAYVARVAGDGSISMPANGALVTNATGMQQYNPVITVDTESERVYVFFKATDPDQIQTGICRQLLDFNGDRLWGESGEMMIPLSTYITMPLYAYQGYYSVVVVYEEGDIPGNDQSMHLKASCFYHTGFSIFSATPIATNSTAKLHFDFASHPDNWISLVWEEGTSGNDIYGMRLNRDGSLGMDYPAPLELSATLVSPTEILLSWLTPYVNYPPLNYQIYMNGELLTTVEGSQFEYTVTGLTPGSYSFYVIAVYPENHNSEPSNTAEIVVVSNSDEHLPQPGLQLSIWPNPVSQQGEIRFFSKDTAPANIAVYNLKGQKVQQLPVTNTKTGWNELSWQPNSKLPAGIYFLRLNTDTEVTVKKLILK